MVSSEPGANREFLCLYNSTKWKRESVSLAASEMQTSEMHSLSFNSSLLQERDTGTPCHEADIWGLPLLALRAWLLCLPVHRALCPAPGFHLLSSEKTDEATAQVRQSEYPHGSIPVCFGQLPMLFHALWGAEATWLFPRKCLACSLR